MKILLVGNGSRDNRGCEALTISTIEALRRSFPEVDIEILSFDAPVDKFYTSYRVNVSSIRCTWTTTSYFIFRVFRKLRMLEKLPMMVDARYKRLAPYLDRLQHVDIVLSLGGDNYTDDYGYCGIFWLLAKLAKKFNKPFVIWGGSVGPFKAKRSIRAAKRSLNSIPLITAREDRTIRYLEAFGYKGDVVRVYDGAFALSAENCKIPSFSRNAKVVGFNISPLYCRYTEQTSEEIIDIVRKFLRIISENYNVLLIPHVVKENISENDSIYMESLVDGLVDILPVNPNYNSMELKYIISKCDYFIGARTHSTIAAYSTGVPTLALAYSLKAAGLNDELFGSHDFLLEAKNFSLESLIEKFDFLVEHSSKAKKCLLEKKKIFKKMIDKGVESLEKFI